MTSIKEILGHIPAKIELRDTILSGMKQALGIEIEKGNLTKEELTLAGKIASKYNEKDQVLESRQLNELL